MVVDLGPAPGAGGLNWTPDSRRLSWLRLTVPGHEGFIESIDLNSRQRSVVLSDPLIRHYNWRPNGNLLYSRREPPPNDSSANLWEVVTDPNTGRARGDPRRLTNWSGFQFTSLVSSASGRQVSFVRWRWQTDIKVAAWQPRDTALAKPFLLTADERMDWLGGWTRDSKSILFYSDRTRPFELYRQHVGRRTPVPIPAAPGDLRNPAMSTDGRWILYLAWPDSPAAAREGWLMRMPATGGAAEMLFQVVGHPGSALPLENRYLDIPKSHPKFVCPQKSGAACVLSEREGDEIIFSAFEPERVGKREIFRRQLSTKEPLLWDLSNNGDSIVMSVGLQPDRTRLEIVTLSGRRLREIDLPDLRNPLAAVWTADDSAFLVITWASTGGFLDYVSPDGQTTRLFTVDYKLAGVAPSPDGQYIAFTEVIADSNAFVIDGLP